jgi:CheY-like chemotaxis protein
MTNRSKTTLEARPSPRRILVIDDRPEIVAAMQWALSRSGHVIDVAFDGESAIAKAFEMQPDVILSDIGLPGPSDGLVVAATLRRSELFESTYLIAITGSSDPEDVKRAVAAGFDLHVSKPVDAHVILRLIAERFEDDAP